MFNVRILERYQANKKFYDGLREEHIKLDNLFVKYNTRFNQPGVICLEGDKMRNFLSDLSLLVNDSPEDKEFWLFWGEDSSITVDNISYYVTDDFYLIHKYEMRINRIFLYRGIYEYENFILIDREKDPPFPCYDEANESYLYDEAAYLPDLYKYITVEEYNNGYTEINGEVVETPLNTQRRDRRFIRQFYFLSPNCGTFQLTQNNETFFESINKLIKSDNQKIIDFLEKNVLEFRLKNIENNPWFDN